MDIQTKKEIITKMILLKRKLEEIIKSFSHAAKMYSDPEKMEKERQRIIQKFVYSKPSIFEELTETSNELSKINPIEAVKLREISEKLFMFEQIKLDNISTIPEQYFNYILTLETTFQIAGEKLSKQIKHLSYTTDIVTMLKVRRYLIIRNKDKDSSFLDVVPLNKEVVEFIPNFESAING